MANKELRDLDVIKDASSEAMLNDIIAYLNDVAFIKVSDSEIDELRIKCNYWFKLANLKGALNAKDKLKKLIMGEVNWPRRLKRI